MLSSAVTQEKEIKGIVRKKKLSPRNQMCLFVGDIKKNLKSAKKKSQVIMCGFSKVTGYQINL